MKAREILDRLSDQLEALDRNCALVETRDDLARARQALIVAASLILDAVDALQRIDLPGETV